MHKSLHRVAVIGLWHLGEVYSAGLAHLGHRVFGISEDSSVVANLSVGKPPLAEPKLEELIKTGIHAKRLTYSGDLKTAGTCDVVWLTFDTPVNDLDESELKPILNCIREVSPHLQSDVLVVVSSQIPAGTSARIEALMRKRRPELKFHYAYAPENLRLGEAVDCFLSPGRIVVGANDDEGFNRLKSIFAGLNAEMVRMSPASAEMAKHALNSFLATSVSFINDIADTCEKVGADIADVTQALRSDVRIGPRAFLNPGVGFSGGTLGRDLVALTKIACSNGCELPVINGVLKKNQQRPKAIIQRLELLLRGIARKRVTLFGLTYKAGTTTLRRSRSLEIASLLIKKGAHVQLCDPHISGKELPRMKNSKFESDPYSSVDQSDALVFLTPWKDFANLDFARLAQRANSRAIVFDTSNAVASKEQSIAEQGLRYYKVGR
jgi:UDPglucose 6-dehydrogenase